MIKTYFKEIAERENGKFYFKDENVVIHITGARTPNVIFQIKFKYKGNKIVIKNRTGTNYIGSIICDFTSHLQIVEFKINSRSHLSNLFTRKKSRFIILCENKNFVHFLNTNMAFKKLSEIANKTNFTPEVDCIKKDKSGKITTNYHLEFDDWTQVIEPMIDFYKNIIDEFEKRNAHLSNSQYRSMNQ